MSACFALVLSALALLFHHHSFILWSLRCVAQCTDAESTIACTAIDESAVKSAASAADVLVYLVGTGEKIESEVVDHGIGATLKLPGKQEQCVALLASRPCPGPRQ